MELDSSMMKILRTLNSGLDLNTFLRVVASELHTLIDVWTIQGYIFDNVGNLQVSNWYGISDLDLKDFSYLTPKFKSPINVCLQTGEILTLPTKAAILKKCPYADSWPFVPESIVAIPLFHGSTIEGVLGFSFRESLESELVDQTKIIVWLTMISELYLVLVSKNLTLSSSITVSGPRQEFTGFRKLSDRHSQILAYLCQGLTNSAISTRIGCSESSVRTEMGKIFAVMAVSSRQEAASKAHKYLESA